MKADPKDDPALGPGSCWKPRSGSCLPQAHSAAMLSEGRSGVRRHKARLELGREGATTRQQGRGELWGSTATLKSAQRQKKRHRTEPTKPNPGMPSGEEGGGERGGRQMRSKSKELMLAMGALQKLKLLKGSRLSSSAEPPWAAASRGPGSLASPLRGG